MTSIANNPRLCTGCFACMNICPKDAIVVTKDILGRTIPMIVAEKCIACGLCIKICPVNSPPVLHPVLHCFAAYSKDREDRLKSASGGLAAIFAREVLDANGVVFGAAYEATQRQAVHMEARSKAGLERLRGSKYTQSFTGLTYRAVQQHLRRGRLVMYVGTPCQIDGLTRFLNQDWDNLIQVDLICHGTPPAQYLEEHLIAICPSANIANISFRGERDFFLTVWSTNGIKYCQPYQADMYFKAFMDGLIFRENCYHCHYAKPQRVSDITVGDFWKLDRSRLKHKYEGKISVVLINTPKGMRFWDQVREACEWAECPLADARHGNAQLNAPSSPDADRSMFEQTYSRAGFERAISKTHVYRDVKSFRRQQWLRSRWPYRFLRHCLWPMIKPLCPHQLLERKR